MIDSQSIIMHMTPSIQSSHMKTPGHMAQRALRADRLKKKKQNQKTPEHK